MKKFNTQLYLLGFIIFTFLIQCTPEEIIRDYPTIETVSIKDVSKKGAVFNATLKNINNYDILEYGFVWSYTGDPNIQNSEKTKNNSGIKSGSFSANIKTTLIEGARYFVKSYVKTKDYLVYGNKLEFVSLGSLGADIDKLEPNSGVWGDTIKIIGNNFSYLKDNNKVKFNDKTAFVVKSNDSIITCIVPEYLTSDEAIIKLSIAEKEVNSPNNFKIKLPIINTITPLTATFGDEITIIGDNFGVKPEYNKVYFGNVLAEVTESSKNSIKVLVPNEIENSIERIKIQSHAVETVFNQDFKLNTPILSFIQPNIKTDTIITIKGKFFHPIKEKNKITFDDIDAEVIDVFKDSIKVKSPVGPFPRRKTKVKIQVLDKVVQYIDDINIQNKWIQVSTNLPFRYRGSVDEATVANGHAYIIAQEKEYDYSSHHQKLYLWKFNEIDFTWSKSNLPFHTDYNDFYGSLLTSDGLDLYLYIPNTNNDFWQFDTNNNTWNKKASFIGNNRNRRRATHFSVNNEIFIGLGSNYVPYTETYYKDFYKYSPSNNQWTKLNDFNVDHRTFSSKFIINDIVYVSGGGESTGHTDCYSYNYKTDTWNRIADLNIIFRRFSGFAINGFGYVLDSPYSQSPGGSRRYDPIKNIWEKSYQIEKYGRYEYFSFVLNGKAYFGCGSSNFNNVDLFDLYQFIP